MQCVDVTFSYSYSRVQCIELALLGSNWCEERKRQWDSREESSGLAGGDAGVRRAGERRIQGEWRDAARSVRTSGETENLCKAKE